VEVGVSDKVSEACVAEGAARFRVYVAVGWRVGRLGGHPRKKGDAGTENDLDRITKNARLRKSLEHLRTRSKRWIKRQEIIGRDDFQTRSPENKNGTNATTAFAIVAA